ncbi:MAG: nuclear transport factor 2 family protein [Candidatus Sulfotelmatobacter sp.]
MKTSVANVAACLLIVLAMALLRVHAQDEFSDSGVRSKLFALENAWSQAAEIKDVKAMDQLLDSAFLYVDFDGRLMTKAEVLANVKSASVQQVVTEAMTANLHGNTVVVTGIFRVKGMEGGKPYLRRGRFIDVWMYENGNWLAISSQATPIAH